MVSEGDTVTVGQDVAKLETGEGGGGGKQEASAPAKEPASGEQPATSDPEPKKEEKPKQEELKKEAPAPPKEEKKPPPPPPSEDKPTSKKGEKPEASPFSAGSRGETRVRLSSQPAEAQLLTNTRQVKMNRMRLRIAERLKQSQNTAASLTTFNEVDMSSIIEFRKLYKEDVLKKTGVKLGFMSAFAKACVLAMKDIPAVNASIEGPGSGDTIVYRDYVDISVAVATPKGLVTPVVRNAGSMDMIGIEQAIADLGKKARDGKLTIEDMAGGTFTISNGGVFGSMMGTPIINLPQTAVLGMHATKDRPVAINGKVEIRPVRNAMLWSTHGCI
jgi:2-oxoglutarate dehydrogenase E2 component (dihydrolipoamide succinyltransferase)